MFSSYILLIIIIKYTSFAWWRGKYEDLLYFNMNILYNASFDSSFDEREIWRKVPVYERCSALTERLGMNGLCVVGGCRREWVQTQPVRWRYSSRTPRYHCNNTPSTLIPLHQYQITVDCNWQIITMILISLCSRFIIFLQNYTRF